MPPPANSPQAGTRAGTPPSYLSALRQLESPVNEDVLNLAATLTTQADEDDDDADEPALRYLRTENFEDWRGERSRDRLRLLERGQREDVDHRDRLRRVMNRLSRIHDPPATGYSDRVPSQNNLYDWSPANEADDEDELDQILAELRREQPNTHPEILRVLGRSQLDTEREARMRTYSSRLLNSNQPPQSADGSLRSAAILQSVRRHPRFSARTRDYIQRYNSSDRDVASRSTPHHSESTRDRYDTSSVRQAAMQRLSERRASLERERDRDRDRDMLNRVDSFRRSYLDRDRLSNPPLTVSPMLEQTIKYLARIRYSANVDDSLNHAIDAGFLNKDYFCEEQSDFILDTFSLPPPVETSWLAPGAVLSGCQHATTVTSTVTPAAASSGATNTLYRFRNGDSMTSTLFDPGRPWLSHNFTPPHRRSTLSAGPETVTSHSPQQDRWPVKVTIHAVDYARMSVSATMEAYNVPSHPHTHQSLLAATPDNPTSPFTRTSSITTYLEGEILDFNQHSFLTESFKSNPANDAMYWRKLPCFQKYSDEELVRNLTSRRFFKEVLCNEWVLMRWKERCFVKSLSRSNTATPSQSNSVQPPDRPMVTDSFQTTTSSIENHYSRNMDVDRGDLEGQATAFEDSSCGLTISGFYYVCLRRSDGKLEGLYYDPQSSPYQCLKLESVNGGVFPAWEFR